MQVTLDARTYPFSPWSAEIGKISEGPVSIDTETTRLDDVRTWLTPAFVLGAAFTGERGYFLTRDNVASFLERHRDNLLVFHNAAFDLDVLSLVCAGVDLYSWVDSNLVADTMLLHQLLSLAVEGHPARRKGQASLEHCVMRYLRYELPKDTRDADGNDVRLSFGKWLSRPASEIPLIYLEYLAKDVVATWQLFQTLRAKIEHHLFSLAGRDAFGFVSGEWLRGCSQRFGPLTHHIQLKASIVLRGITAVGLHLNVDQSAVIAANLDRAAAELQLTLRKYGYVPGEKGNGRALQHILEGVLREHPQVTLPTTTTGKLSAKAEDLEPLADVSPFVRAYLDFTTTTKIKTTYANKMQRAVLHPSFSTLVNTGRTSSFGEINAQNLPRDDRVRSCFVPSPGHVFIDADYKAIEMVTLAQSIVGQLRRPSRLAEALNRSEDPHQLLASRLLGKPPAEVSKAERQKAKAINFGKPGGMGDRTLRQYAAANYGIQLTEEEATALSGAWLDLYPEMHDYLASDLEKAVELANYIGLSMASLDAHCGRADRRPVDLLDSTARLAMLGGMLLKIVSDETPSSREGTPYSDETVDYFWEMLVGVIDRLPANVQCDVTRRRPGHRLRQALVQLVDRRGVYTLSGRLRGQAGYCARRNTPFQGLAADGAKLALWRLWRSGYRLVNFIHDEVLIEVPAGADLTLHANRVRELMIAGMHEVVPDILVEVELAAASCWSKDAKELRDEQGRLCVWHPAEAQVTGVVADLPAGVC